MLASPVRSLSQGSTQGFELWYQPIYDVNDGAVLYNEALLRWRDPAGQVYLPRHFMPSITQGQVPEWLDRLVVQKAIQTLVASPPLCLSINLSDQVFRDSQFVDFVYGQLTRGRLRPSQLQFELSERHLSQNLADAIVLIQDLRSIGCAVVLDGFANEYLTFLQWEKLNVSSIKVDGQLLQGAHDSRQQSQLTQSIVETSYLFEQPAVAKSIDAQRRSRALNQLNFASAQGYHFKPPSRRPWLVGKVDILGVPIDNLSQAQLLDQLSTGIVFTSDVNDLINLRKNKTFAAAYNVADYRVCDSQALVLASQLLGTPLAKQLPGSELLAAFCDRHQLNPETTLFLLGGTDGTAAQQTINQAVGRQMVVGTCAPSRDFEADAQECQAMVERINQSGATVLAIGIGSPQQETWVHRYQEQLTSVQIIFALGDATAFDEGIQKDCPGQAWLQRLATGPKRLWKRYFVNDLSFLYLLLQQKLSQGLRP
ncbi:MAG: EAL domain-containing protein [Thermosynechococcaceae cyanobacterium]